MRNRLLCPCYHGNLASSLALFFMEFCSLLYAHIEAVD